ncbi:unnamed protein product [Anisakis simplex]|uniref:Connector of kinase to AP-1 (inferred by orthology to a D. melanogaster protein) n=1 Tax=Anisakis simplex TaxID=6269 RepID=A0A0M3KGH5_ANISI|nr:unnamed protein product [Anisakis simplex]
MFRAKNYRLTHNGQEPDMEESTEDAQNELENQVPLDVDAYSGQANSANSFRESRALLRQYLQEIGYSEAILDVRSFRAKNLLGLVMFFGEGGTHRRFTLFLSTLIVRQAAAKALQDTDRAVMEVAHFLNKKKGGDTQNRGITDDSDSDDEDKVRKGAGKDGLDPETVDALGEFSFLKEDGNKSPTGTAKKRVDSGADEWSVNQHTINQMKEKFRSEQERKRSNSQSESPGGASKNTSLHQMFRTGHDDIKRELPTDEIQQMFGAKSSKKDYMDINAALGIADEANVDIKDEFNAPDDDNTAIRWNLKFTLRSHYDSIRVMQFHPVEPVLITASEDGTAKLWNLGTTNPKSESAKGGS